MKCTLVCRFNLRKAQKRQHIVEGLLKAMHDLDKVVATIRAAKDGSAAALQLQQHFNLSPEQVRITHSFRNRQDGTHCCPLIDSLKRAAPGLAYSAFAQSGKVGGDRGSPQSSADIYRGTRGK